MVKEESKYSSIDMRPLRQFFVTCIAFVCILIAGFLFFDKSTQLYLNPLSLGTASNSTETMKPSQNLDLLEVKDYIPNAEDLFGQIRVVCFVLTMPTHHLTSASAINETWGSRCNKLFFVSTQEDENLDVLALNFTEDRNYLWRKTKSGFNYSWNEFGEEGDWFLKADDDTFVIMENLRYMLSSYNPMDPIWFGYRFKKFTDQGYMSGGASYVLSKEAVRRFIEEALPNPKLCRSDYQGAEDAEMGICLENVGVVAKDSRDSEGRERFHPFTPDNHLVPHALGDVPWYWEYAYYTPRIGLQCCSNTIISFHYIDNYKMYEMDFFIYHLNVFGAPSPHLPFPLPHPPDEVNNSTTSPL